MIFEDRHEVVFERVKIEDNKIDIVVKNINGSMNPILRIEESEFPGTFLNEQKLVLYLFSQAYLVFETKKRMKI